MHYYQFNIGNYRRQTHHLTILEHGIYRTLLDTYYLDEKPLCKDKARLMRTHNVRSAVEQEAFENVISDFFYLSEDGYRHKTCDEAIAKYQEKSQKASKSAKARWEKYANAMRTHSERYANHKPITNNQEPPKEKKVKKESRFKPPTTEEVAEYCAERNNSIDPATFVDFYTAKNWMVGKTKMKDWRACVRTWEKRNQGQGNGTHQQTRKLSVGERATEHRKRAERIWAEQENASRAVGADDAHLRPPLDGEFRRDGD